MAAIGYTPIQLYYSTTAAALPSSSNLQDGELAINIADGKLYYKDNLGNVQLLASKASLVGVDSISFGTTGLTPATATTGAVTVAGTLNVANGGTGLTSLATGRIPYGNNTSAFSSSTNFLFTGNALKIGTFTTIPAWTNSNAIQFGTNGTAAIENYNGLTNASWWNAQRDGSGNLVYTTFNAAIGFSQSSSGFTWYKAGTGNPGDTVMTTEAMSLSIGGQLTVPLADAFLNGVRVGRGGGNLSTNTVLGSSALAGNTTGYNNVAIGVSALQAQSTGHDNIAIGYSAFSSNTLGSGSIAIGNYALSSVTAGGSNVAIGFESLKNQVVPGGQNVAVGWRAGFSNTTGVYNTFIGTECGYSFVTGEGNTYVGSLCGYDMTSGSKNTILGRFSGNQGGLDIRTASEYIVLSDGWGTPKAYWDAAGVMQQNGNMNVAGNISDSIGNVRSIPQTTTSSNYILQLSDNGKHINYTLNNGSVEPPALGSAPVGYVATIFNNTNTTITIYQVGTLRQAGTTNTGNRTLSPYGVATILCVATSTYVISGSGLN